MDSYDELASGAPDWYAGILTLLGRGKHDEALRQAREQLTIAKENSSNKDKLPALHLIVKAQLGKGNSWDAKKTADEATDLAKSMKDAKLIAGTSHLLAKVEIKEKKLDEADAAAKAAEAGYKTLKFEAGVAAVTSTMASLAFARKDLDKALETANAARAMFKGIGDASGEASSLKVAVDIKMSENRYYHALLLVEDMVNLYNQGSNIEGEAAAQLLAAELQVAQGDLQNAMDRSSAAAELFDKIGDSKKKGQAVLVMAKAFLGADQLQDATQAADAACGLFQEGRDKRGLAVGLVTLAECMSAQAKFSVASYKLEEAAFLWRQLKDKKEEATIMASLASTQCLMFGNPQEMPLQGWPDADKEKSAANAARAAELFGECGMTGSSERGRAMLSQAHVLNLLKRHDEALAKAVDAQTLFQDVTDLGGQSTALLIIGNAYSGKDLPDAAIEALEKCRELAEEAGEGNVKDVSQRIKEIGRYKAQSGGKRGGDDETRMDIQIIRGEVPIIQYDAFEGRQMRTGPAGSSSSSVAALPGEAGYVAPAKLKVLYNLRMQRVPNVDMNASAAITA